MRLHLARIREVTVHFLDNAYVEITTVPLTTQKLKEKQEHNQAMMKVASTLSYVKFDEI